MALATSSTRRGAVRTTTTEEVADTSGGYNLQNVLTNIVWFVCGVILILLGFRFVLALLGANPTNGFANFIYSVSHPFASPFFGLFSYNYRYGVSRFEIYTLVAMLVYLVVAWLATTLININRRPTEL